MAIPDAGPDQTVPPRSAADGDGVEVIGVEIGPRAGSATSDTVALDLNTVRLRDCSTGGDGTPILVHAPFAGHSSAIAEFQSVRLT